MITQLARFATVGAIATFLHVLAALFVSTFLEFSPQAANATGFVTAIIFSYFGHGRLTFETELRHEHHGPKFMVTALSGFLVSSCLTQVIAVWFGAPFVFAMAVVAIAVPLSTFVLCKFWVFRPTYSGRT
ncbi:MAG: GtrA family protein [Pseudomonadota bacterium]